jgi:hypothetical protein
MCMEYFDHIQMAAGGALISKLLVGTRRSISKMADSYFCCQNVSALCCLLTKGLSSLQYGPLHRLFECLHEVTAAFHQSKQFKRESKEETAVPFMTDSHTVSSTKLHLLEGIEVPLKRRGIRLYYEGGVSKNLWTSFCSML